LQQEIKIKKKVKTEDEDTNKKEKNGRTKDSAKTINFALERTGVTMVKLLSLSLMKHRSSNKSLKLPIETKL
jgi:hypothetical protein